MDGKNWNDAVLISSASIEEVIKSLNYSMLKIVVIVDEENKLIGTVTDGDIRRALLGEFSLKTKAIDICNSNPIVVSHSLGKSEALDLMQVNKIYQLPIVNGVGILVGMHIWESLITLEKRENVIVIMAGGKGKRLRPLTENCPKPMIPIGGKPILERIIEQAKGEGFYKFVISVHYLGHMIEEYFGNGEKLGIEISYLREDTPLGTAGALSLIETKLSAPILITNGDVLADVKYREMIDFHSMNKATATMAVRQHKWENPFGVVRTNGVDILGFSEKPITCSQINAGIYVVNQRALDILEEDVYCDMPTLFDKLRKIKERTIVYPMHESWVDVGRHDDLEKANKSILDRVK